MGLYNCVNFETECPVCRRVLNDFQTKENPLGGFDTKYRLMVQPTQVNQFYSDCDWCRAEFLLGTRYTVWIEYNYRPTFINALFCDRKLSDYQRTQDLPPLNDVEYPTYRLGGV